MKKTMTETTRPSWTASIADYARERQIPLPPFSRRGIGSVRTESTASGRFATIKWRLVTVAEAEKSGIEFTLWRAEDDLPIPVFSLREPVEPDRARVAQVASILKGWLIDEMSLEEAKTAVGVNAAVGIPEITPERSDTREYWLSDDREFGIVVKQERWAILALGKAITSWRSRDNGDGGDHLPLESLDRYCQWLVAQWPVLAHGRDVRPDRLRGSRAAANQAYENARLTQAGRDDGEIESWWARHAIRAADAELPNVFLERQTDSLVVSWDASPAPARFYEVPYGVAALPLSIAIPTLRRLVVDRLRSMNMRDDDRARVLTAVSSDAAVGYAALAEYNAGINVEWLAQHGFSREDAADVALSGVSRHPIVGLLRSSRGGSISASDYDSILGMLKPSDRRSFERLRELARGLSSPIDVREPWESGYHLARLVRERLGGDPSQYLDIESLVRALGVDIQEIDLPDAEIRGACIGGPAYAPLILLNRACPDASGLSGRRTTLAHELGHLLFDRAGLRSFARFEGGAAADNDRLIEMRANAFAIELLVPMATLVDATGAVLDDDRLLEASRAQEVSFAAIERHAGNLRRRLSQDTHPTCLPG